MATSEEVVAAAPEAAALEAGLKHKLERKWTFWCDNQSKPKQGAAWGTSLRKVYTFDTVEEFWCLYDQVFKPSKLQINADFHLFKTGIEPKWEDPECANGGKWSVTSNSGRKANLDNMWLETMMALIGEQFEDAEDICGVVASVRQWQDKLSLWTKTAANEAAQRLNLKGLKDILTLILNTLYGCCCHFNLSRRLISNMIELKNESLSLILSYSLNELDGCQGFY
ncbi:Eukaryotic translation initiation factor isoform 4E-2 isoform B [Glycine soja]|uniref:Eukaryotic translation initiation factor isoform 4E n=1 Tax=Glycine soja TaxID=3848 RepID=A0A445F2E9_GLYSO|nr:Eukaryotic translation initiation factor isoform 4E-2 isoform B [Glycine soja]